MESVFFQVEKLTARNLSSKSSPKEILKFGIKDELITADAERRGVKVYNGVYPTHAGLIEKIPIPVRTVLSTIVGHLIFISASSGTQKTHELPTLSWRHKGLLTLTILVSHDKGKTL
ncbi:unnamed protein product, partial [Nesidiocoris tenuis]